MKLFQYTEDARNAQEVEIPKVGVHFLIETESGTFRIRADKDGISVRETTGRNLALFPLAATGVDIRGAKP